MQSKKVLLIILLFLGTFSSKSQIFINEFSTSGNPGPAVAPGFNNQVDWVELYNAWSLPLSLSGYYLTDDKANLYKWKCPNVVMSASSTVLFYCDGRNTQEPAPFLTYHTNFDLQQCKNQWLILALNGAVKDSFLVSRCKPGDVRGRFPDGGQKGILQPPSPNGLNAPVATWYKDYAPAPTFSTNAGYTVPSSGFYDPNIIPTDTVDFAINYTLDGTYPCATFKGCPGIAPAPITYSYTDNVNTPIATSGTTTVIRAIAFKKPAGYFTTPDPYLPSFVTTNTYFDGPDNTVNPGFGVLSICVDPTFFQTATSQTLHAEYFDNYQFWSEGSGGIAKPINDPWGHQQRGFDVSILDENGDGCAIKGNVFNDPNLGTSTRTVFPNFEVRVAGKDNFSAYTPTLSTPYPIKGTQMRDAFVQTYAQKIGLNLDPMHYKPIRTFVNGVYYGIYEFREVPNWEYADYYYNHKQDSSEILFQHGGPGIINGVDTGWVTLPLTTTVIPSAPTVTTAVFNMVRNFPVQMPGPWYDMLMRKLDKQSFMDFFIYNSYLVNVDITNYNNTWWRGVTPSNPVARKWRYSMWDMNNSLDLDTLPSSIPLSVANMTTSPCVYTSTNAISYSPSSYTTVASAYTGHGYMLWRLMQNVNFKNDYFNRYMDLLNTSLRCDKMLAHFNYMKNMFTPEITLHSTFWGVNDFEWAANMDTLEKRITQRCTGLAKELAKSTCGNFIGPYTISVDVRPSGAGTVDFNSLHLTSFVWSGSYYQTRPPNQNFLKTFLRAIPVDTNMYVFDHWEFASSTHSTNASPDDETPNTHFLSSDSIAFNIVENDNIVAVFAEKSKDIVVPTGFTPNGDGVNDVLYPLGVAVRYSRDYEFQVWNRWGQEVFRTANSAEGWDGYHNGTQAQPGVYAYMIKYKNVLNESKIVKGNVTLIR